MTGTIHIENPSIFSFANSCIWIEIENLWSDSNKFLLHAEIWEFFHIFILTFTLASTWERKKKKSPLLELLKTISKLSIYFSGQTLGDLNICPEKKTDESVSPSKPYHLIAQMSVSFHNLLKVQWNKAEVLATQLCLTPRDLMDCRPPGSSVHETLQARILECVAVLFSRDLPNPEIEPGCPVLQAGFFTVWATREAI